MTVRDKLHELTGFYFKNEPLEDVFQALGKAGKLDIKTIGLLLGYVLDQIEKTEQK